MALLVERTHNWRPIREECESVGRGRGSTSRDWETRHLLRRCILGAAGGERSHDNYQTQFDQIVAVKRYN